MTTTESDMRIEIGADAYTDICDTVEKICREFPAEYWRELEDRPLGDRYPASFVAALGGAGIMAALVPEAYDGAGLPLEAAAAIIETIHATGCNAALPIQQFRLTALLAGADNEPLKRAILPRLADGSLTLQAFAHDEADDAGCVAVPSGDAVALSGTKTRVLAPVESGAMIVSARENDTDEKPTALYLVEAGSDSAGLVPTPYGEMTNTCVADVRFDKVAILASNRIAPADTGGALIVAADVVLRILEAAAAIGDGRFFSRRGAAYAKERVVFGNPIGKYQGIQFPLAKAHIEVEAAFIGLRRAMALYDAGLDAGVAASVAHYLAMEAAWNMADAAFTTHGGFAFAREYDIERKWRDVRAMKLAAVPYKGDLTEIGESALGLPRSY
ncbi:MAG: acyl-CoA dehydrogenase [Rhodospirillaceae bacterium]|nr:acyl-CoA dehydrogenase [Rhodospirillaceae bacterium]|tara:strand:+ start:15914 stop:17074 length:1161 start_codon:yes stop_codon:yes gene_type:complete